MVITRVEDVAEVGGVIALVAGLWVSVARAGALQRRREWLARRRARDARGAALEAAQETASFDPDRILEAVSEMLDDAAETWRSPGGGPQLVRALSRWARQHDGGAGTRLQGRRSLQLLRVVNREGEAEDRVVVRVRVAIRRGAPGPPGPKLVHVDERWTLARSGERWYLIEFDDGPLSEELLHSTQIASGDKDTARLSQQSFEELAQGVAAPASVAGLTDPSAAPYLQLLDLSLLDDRFSPALIDTTLRELLDAWEESTNGSSEPLRARVGEETAHQLIAPTTRWENARLMLRDGTLTSWQPVAIDTGDPPRITLTVNITAVRYLVDGATGAGLAGSQDLRHEIVLEWTIRQSSRRPSWQLVHTTDPAAEIPGTT